MTVKDEIIEMEHQFLSLAQEGKLDEFADLLDERFRAYSGANVSKLLNKEEYMDIVRNSIETYEQVSYDIGPDPIEVIPFDADESALSFYYFSFVLRDKKTGKEYTPSSRTMRTWIKSEGKWLVLGFMSAAKDLPTYSSTEADTPQAVVHTG